MRKFYLLEKQKMNAAAFVDAAAEAASRMVARESRGPGDVKNAMRRLSSRHGIPYATLWALRYRRPKDILASSYAAILDAYDSECERQERAIAHERSLVTAKNAASAALLRAADYLVGAGD